MHIVKLRYREKTSNVAKTKRKHAETRLQGTVLNHILITMIYFIVMKGRRAYNFSIYPKHTVLVVYS